MYSKLLSVVIALVLVSSFAYAQFNGPGFSGGLGFGFTQGRTDAPEDQMRFISRAFIRKGLTENFMGEFGFGIGRVGGSDFNTLLFPFDLRVIYSPIQMDSWNPFLYGGYGLTDYKVDELPPFPTKGARLDYWTGNFPIGAGLQFKFIPKANFEVVGGYNATRTWDLNAFRKTGRDGYWNVLFNLSSTLAAENQDPDGDGLLNDVEKQLGTDPNNKDTDGDGLSDGDEVNTYHTNPLIPDSDGDGISDGDEVLKYHSDPNKQDTDGDLLTDGDEILKYHTDPLKKDTDGGTVDDGVEVKRGTNPLDPSDDVVKETPKPPEPAKEEPKKEEPKIDLAKVEKETPIVLEGITFDFNSANITSSSEGVLNGVVTTMKTHPEIEVEVLGHTDSVGTDAYNMKLSQRRADAVRTFLVKNGVEKKRIATKGFGETKPVAPNDTEEGRQKNRRIEFSRTK